MGHRLRAQRRIERRVPGECVRKSSTIEDAIVYRTRPLHTFEPRDYYGEALLQRSAQSIKKAKTVEAGPNAPLLIRLVRDPYALQTARMQRTPSRDVDLVVTRSLDRFPNAMSEWDKVRFKGFVGNPVRDLGIGLTRRLSPTAHTFSDEGGRWSCRSI